MSLISSIQTYIKTYTGLASGAPVWVNFLNAAPTAYSINPQPGARALETYINGSSLREFPFSLQIMESSADEPKRLATAAFAEAFVDWLESQTKAGAFPTLATGQTPYLIEAVNWGYLEQQGESATAIYLITCRLVYDQAA